MPDDTREAASTQREQIVFAATLVALGAVSGVVLAGLLNGAIGHLGAESRSALRAGAALAAVCAAAELLLHLVEYRWPWAGRPAARLVPIFILGVLGLGSRQWTAFAGELLALLCAAGIVGTWSLVRAAARLTEDVPPAIAERD
jgi:hypothetical protein